jgi:hypothetical protein
MICALIVSFLGLATSEPYCALKGEEAPPATAKTGEQAAPTYTYKGKPRNADWMKTMYAKFKDKIAVVDGKLIDVGRALLDLQPVEPQPPSPGTELRLMPGGSKVLQVLGVDSILVRVEEIRARRIVSPDGKSTQFEMPQPEILFHVAGVDTTGLVDGTRLTPRDGTTLWPRLVFAGTFRYTATDGSAKTIQSYRPYAAPTFEQFAPALASGFELVEYSMVPAKPARKPASRPSGGRQGGDPSKQGEEPQGRIVAKPVP